MPQSETWASIDITGPSGQVRVWVRDALRAALRQMVGVRLTKVGLPTVRELDETWVLAVVATAESGSAAPIADASANVNRSAAQAGHPVAFARLFPQLRTYAERALAQHGIESVQPSATPAPTPSAAMRSKVWSGCGRRPMTIARGTTVRRPGTLLLLPARRMARARSRRNRRSPAHGRSSAFAAGVVAQPPSLIAVAQRGEPRPAPHRTSSRGFFYDRRTLQARSADARGWTMSAGRTIGGRSTGRLAAWLALVAATAVIVAFVLLVVRNWLTLLIVLAALGVAAAAAWESVTRRGWVRPGRRSATRRGQRARDGRGVLSSGLPRPAAIAVPNTAIAPLHTSGAGARRMRGRRNPVWHPSGALPQRADLGVPHRRRSVPPKPVCVSPLDAVSAHPANFLTVIHGHPPSTPLNERAHVRRSRARRLRGYCPAGRAAPQHTADQVHWRTPRLRATPSCSAAARVDSGMHCQVAHSCRALRAGLPQKVIR